MGGGDVAEKSEGMCEMQECEWQELCLGKDQNTYDDPRR